MEKNIKEKISNCNLKNANGITLVALVVTIIVLLILAAVSLSAVFSQDGIFSRAENATDKYGQAKARETLELTLSDFQITKYEEGLSGENYENRLDSKISEVGSLIPKEEENSKYQLVIVDGHIFEIDRSVPKIVDYKGPADGIIITAQIKQNGDWENPVATVTGTITKYGGGSVVSSTATATEGVTITGFPTTGGSYTIPNITKDTDITITASADDGKPAVTKIIKVRLIRDNTPPVISEQEAILSEKTEIINGMKIRIKATAIDNESGLASLTYKIEPNTIKDGKAEGMLTSGIPIEVEATAVGNYTVTFTAKDDANNTATATAGPVRASDKISIGDLKDKINADNYPDYIGIKVDYKPDDTKEWRVFYYDATGEFGDGAGTIYLKRDCDTTTTLSSYASHVPADGGALMRQLNPAWAKSANGKKATTDWLENEHCASWLCDSTKWTTYKTADAKYAIGAAPIEMWTKAYNAYVGKYETSDNKVNCGIENTTGYGWGLNGGTLDYSRMISINTSIPQSAVIATSSAQWLASPSFYGNGKMCCVAPSVVGTVDYSSTQGTCLVVSLNH